MSTQSVEQLLQDMMTQYCDWSSSSVYPDMNELRDVLTLLSDQQKLRILQQNYSIGVSPLHWAAVRDDTEMISTLLTSLESSADRLKLLMVNDKYTPLHEAAHHGHTESVKMILDCLTADHQIQLMSAEWWGETVIQKAESTRHTDTVRLLTEYQHRADNLMKEKDGKF